MKKEIGSVKRSHNHAYILSICFIASLGGFMFGFDLGIIGGVIPYIEHQFELFGFWLGLVVAIFELGAMIGALGTSRIADVFGRKRAMLACALLLTITAIGVATSGGSVSLAFWRLAQGICVGAASVLSPMYIAEVAPPEIRGKLVSLNQLTIILGILIASCYNYYFGSNDLGSMGWRYMFLSALVPSLLFLLLLFFIPESPRWMISRSGNEEEANRILMRINNGDENRTHKEIGEIRNAFSDGNVRTKTSFRDLFKKRFLPIILIGFGIASLQQLCGINNVTPYMQKIFIMAGVKLTDGLFNAVMVQLVFFLSTFIAIVLIDKIGRRFLMLAGTGLMAFSLICLALVFQLEIPGGIFVLVLMMIYIGSFGFTLGPVVWVLISEMFPTEIRGKAIAMTSAVLWLATFIIVFVSPWLLNIGASTNFMVFGILNILGFIFCYKYLPETKGKSLEQMKEIWQKQRV